MSENGTSLTLEDAFEIGRVADPDSAENKSFGAYMTGIFQKLKAVEPNVFDRMKAPRFLLSDDEKPDAAVFLGTNPPVFAFTKGLFDVVTTQDEMAAVLTHTVASTVLSGKDKDVFALNALEKAGFNKRAGISVYEKVNPFQEIDGQNAHSFFKLCEKNPESLTALCSLLETPESAPSPENKKRISPIKPMLRVVWMKSDKHVSFIDRMKKENGYKEMTGQQQMAFWNSLMKSYDYSKAEAEKLPARERHRMQEIRKAYDKYVKAVDLPEEYRYVIKDKLVENALQKRNDSKPLEKKEIKKEIEQTDAEKKKELIAKTKEALKKEKKRKKEPKKRYRIDGEEIELHRFKNPKNETIEITANDLFNDLPSKDPRIKAIAKAIYIDEMNQALNGKAIEPDKVPPNFKITFNSSTQSTAEKLPSDKKEGTQNPSAMEKVALGQALCETYKKTKDGAQLKETLLAEIDKRSEGSLKNSPYLAAFKETVENLDQVAGKMGETTAEQNKAFQDAMKNMVKSEEIDPAILRGMTEDKEVKKELMKDLPLTKKMALNAKMAVSKMTEKPEHDPAEKIEKPKIELKEKIIKPKEKEKDKKAEESPKPAFIAQKLDEISRKKTAEENKTAIRRPVEITPSKTNQAKDMLVLRGKTDKQTETGIPQTSDLTKPPPQKPKDFTIPMPRQNTDTNTLRVRRNLSKQAG